MKMSKCKRLLNYKNKFKHSNKKLKNINNKYKV